MNYFKILLYGTLIGVLFIVPLYAVGRIYLPEWIQSQIAARLPEGSTLKIGKIKSNIDLSINYENLYFESKDNLLKLNLSELVISPKLNFKEPLEFTATEANFKIDQLVATFLNLKSKLSLNFDEITNSTISGQVERLQADELAAFTNISFFLDGLNSKNKKIDLTADTIKLKFETPMGQVLSTYTDVAFKANMGKDLITNLNSKSIIVDLSSLGNKVDKNILIGKDLILKFKINNESLVAPLFLNVSEIKSSKNEILKEINATAEAKWRFAKRKCSIIELLKNQPSCGKFTDVVNVNIEMLKDKSRLNFKGDGHCVTPKAGCKQKIYSTIRTKNTTEIFSKLMTSGTVNPLFAGIVLGSLLSSPQSENSEFDHEVTFEVEGSKINVNGKPLI